MTDSFRHILIGSYTETLPHVNGRGHGIYSSGGRQGEMSAPQLAVEAVSPAWLVASGNSRQIYAVNETKRFGDREEGGLSAFSRDEETGALTLINAVNSGGVEPAHLALDRTGRFLVVANYRSGSIAVFSVRADGGIGEMTHRVEHSGSSVHPVRQTSPHPHQVVLDPVDGTLWVPDLGIDAVLHYELDESGRLTEIVGDRLVLAPGAGPRHLGFAPDGSGLVVVNELDATLALFRRAGSPFRLTHVVPATRDRSGDTVNSGSEVAFTPSGRSIVVSNRGVNSLGLFRLTEGDGLESIDEVSSHGEWPRSFAFVPGGRLLVANQNSDSIDIFELDEVAGTLHWRSAAVAPTPSAILVL